MYREKRLDRMRRDGVVWECGAGYSPAIILSTLVFYQHDL